MKFIIIFIFIFLSANEFNDYLIGLNKEYASYTQNLEKEFKEYKEYLNKEYKRYQKELSKYWENPEIGNKTTFIEYSEDKLSRKKVDFKNKFIQLDVISTSLKDAKLKLAKNLLDLSIETENQAFFRDKVLVKVDNKFKNIGRSSRVSNSLIIGDVLFRDKKNINIIKFVRSNVKDKNIKIKKSKIKNYNVYTLKIPLVEKFYILKAKKYKNYVFFNSKRFSISPSLIYAIIQTESSYNPLAKSYVPAFGLMQIVPQTAGKDVTKKLYKREILLTPSYLFNERNNILIGSAYLNILYYDYFKGVKNSLSRLFLSIAAYNTGAGNVVCVFNSNRFDSNKRIRCSRAMGDYNIKKALPKINSLTSKEIYSLLVNKLRYDEARNYLKIVFKRFLIYKESLKKGVI